MNVIGPVRMLQARRTARLAALFSVATALALEFAWTWYSYGYVRSGFVAPAFHQYLVCLLGLSFFGGPFLVMLAGARCLLNPSVSIRLHVIMFVLIVAFGVAAAEGWIGAQDILLTQSPPLPDEWLPRWFPFGDKSATYDPVRGWHVGD